MAQVNLQNVNKIYRSGRTEVHAVQDLNLEINNGEFVALLGPSGCGKTSTLRMIVGLEEISSGDINFNGKRVNELEPQHRNVAMAFETYALYPNFTIEENLAFPLEVRGVPEDERRRKARDIAEILKLTSILDQRPGALSGGQQQRVSLGRALIRDPSVFILDEVMSHIDAHLKFQMLFDLKAIHRDLGKTMVYVTHDQVEALALADRVAVMSNAKLQQVGTRNELYNAPANVFVADFIGEPPTNFFQAEVSDNGGGLALKTKDGALVFHLTEHRAGKIRALGGRDFIVGIRPQNLRLKDSEGKSSAHTGSDVHDITASILINEYLGERSILTFANGDTKFRALVPPETRAAPGEAVTLGYRPEDVMVFDAQTEALID
ncbi:ABC transporter ATP-binding protein [Pelagibius sp. Alg239-R121]|uniref:ABC transporter ATP-binding protein n=1 Tax=Pelagibius sp. Alg239-R121 TaxID=2993448 RepID=UPI0024A634D3|nr:ABC transporter ATP-binding protein [Pelagibius sp. Alg239-R121]